MDLRDLINKYRPACIALQETYLKTDKNSIRHYKIFSKHHIDHRASGGVAILAASDIPSIPLTLNTELQAVAIRLHMHSLVTVCSLYLPPNERINQSDLNNLILQLPPPFVILGDLNGHSPLWGSSDANSRGQKIEQLLADHNLCLLNSDEKTHFHLPTRTFHSVDLAICSPSLLPFYSLTVDNDLYNSDHFPLILTDNRNNPISSFRPPKYVLNAADWQKFTSLANINLDIVKSSTIEEALNYIINIIIEAADNSIPKTSGNRRRQNKPWWNDDCKQAYKKQRKAWDIFRRYPTTLNFIHFKKTRADSRRIQRRSRKISWQKFVSSITSTISSRQLWKKVKKASGISHSNAVSVLIDNGRTISSLKGIANSIGSTLSHTSSSQNYPLPILNHKNNAEKEKLNFNSQTNRPYNCDLTFLEFQSCLSNAHDSSPGPDNISYAMIKHLTIESQKSLLHLYNRIWKEHYFPTIWQQAIVIPLLKPGKDPTNPSNYRPIALTCCLCKLLEKIVNRRLIYFLEIHNFIHPSQSGFRRGRSTVDNLLALETDIRLAFLQRKHLVAVFFDIEKAYDKTWRYGILKDMHDTGLKGNLPIFIKNFLKLRKFQIRVESELSDFFVQEEGVPQGSVLSVTLFILKINGILKQLQPSVKSFLYVDDLYISCTGVHMNFIQRQLQIAINSITQWSKVNGFTISTSKTAAVHFCRKRSLHFDPELKLNSKIIPFINEIRFLGVVFDKKLSFLPHVKQLRKKCEKSLNILKVLSTTAWGADRVSMLKIYKATILSKLDYGCTIYGSARKSVLQKLDPVHHTALRLCSGAFRTSPVKSLYVDCCEPALEHRRQLLSLNYFFRIGSNPCHPFYDFKLRPFLVRLQEARKSFIPVFFTRINLTLSELNLLYLRPTLQPNNTFPPWEIPDIEYLNPFKTFKKSDTTDVINQKIFLEHRHHYQDSIPIYTDGLKSAAHVSFAVVFPDKTISFTLHSSCSVFTAEALAVLFALKEISDGLQRNFIIYTDSLSVLQSLKSFYPHPHNHPVVLNILDLFNKLALRGFNIMFCWVPSHVGILGNEQADRAAKSAVVPISIGIPVGDLKKHVEMFLHTKWQEQWDLETDNKLHTLKPLVQPWPSLANRKADTLITRLRIGHTRFTHLHLLFGEEPPMCSSCNCRMSVRHILLECPNFYIQRLQFFQTSSISLSNLLGITPHVQIFAFLRSINFYSQI
ncbi:putative RNA-directed DNA polymerase from transposon X-element [Araneus ventricosus]|uniref:Putative RNA-directed DNA polymerase from transposon X-element n=1 Tax=Araneus ventricosus TaxID=182803 RepID=A0A4Y2Q9R3_ARAVE|nr:putative RNA-directed DNA polymerase from transposon X-element [Araneus ventricosus]